METVGAGRLISTLPQYTPKVDCSLWALLCPEQSLFWYPLHRFQKRPNECFDSVPRRLVLKVLPRLCREVARKPLLLMHCIGP